jgi:hypothetical protein
MADPINFQDKLKAKQTEQDAAELHMEGVDGCCRNQRVPKMTESKPWWTEPQVDLFGLDSKDHYVYRYRSASRAIQELRTRRLRMSSFKELNDPKEFADWRFDLFSRQR